MDKVMNQWGHLPGSQFKILLVMAHFAMDQDPEPVYFGGWERLSEIGLCRSQVPTGEDLTPEQERERREAWESVRKPVNGLLAAGAITVKSKGRHGSRATWALTLEADTKGQRKSAPYRLGEGQRKSAPTYPQPRIEGQRKSAEIVKKSAEIVKKSAPKYQHSQEKPAAVGDASMDAFDALAPKDRADFMASIGARGIGLVRMLAATGELTAKVEAWRAKQAQQPRDQWARAVVVSQDQRCQGCDKPRTPFDLANSNQCPCGHSPARLLETA
jgi:hypothetical protein